MFLWNQQKENMLEPANKFVEFDGNFGFEFTMNFALFSSFPDSLSLHSIPFYFYNIISTSFEWRRLPNQIATRGKWILGLRNHPVLSLCRRVAGPDSAA